MRDNLSVLGIHAGVAQTTFGGGMDGPCHVVDAPVVGLALDLLGGRLSCCRSNLLPSFVADLLPTVTIVLLVFGLGAYLRLAGALPICLLPFRSVLLECRRQLKLTFELLNLCRQGNHGRVCILAPFTFIDEVVVLVRGGGHERFMGERWGLSIVVHVVLALNVVAEVGTVDGEIDLEEDADGIIDGSSTSDQLRVVLMEERMDLWKIILQA